MADVDVDGARLAVVSATPEGLEEHPPAVNAARVRGQRPQQLELDVGELDRFPAHLDRPARDVDLEAVHRDQLVPLASGARSRGAAKKRPHTAAELADREGL